MIELAKKTEFVTAVQKIEKSRAKYRPDGTAAAPEIEKLLEKYPDVTLVGSGAEVLVVADPKNESKVVSF